MRRMIDPKQLGGGEGQKFYDHFININYEDSSIIIYIDFHLLTRDKDAYTSLEQINKYLQNNVYGLGNYFDKSSSNNYPVISVINTSSSYDCKYYNLYNNKLNVGIKTAFFNKITDRVSEL